jgi:hypothetical protein
MSVLCRALADVRIVSSLGGSVGSYLSFFSRVRQSGERLNTRVQAERQFPAAGSALRPELSWVFTHPLWSTSTVGDFALAKRRAQWWQLTRHEYVLGLSAMAD